MSSSTSEEINMPNDSLVGTPSLSNDGIPHTKLEYCPECLKIGVRSPVHRYQLTDDIYLIFCSDENECTYHEEFQGKALVDKVDVTNYGFPEELWQHVDIYPGDLPKIVYLCIHEYVINKYFSTTSWDRSGGKELEDMFRLILSLHEDDSVTNFTTFNLENMLREKMEELILDLTPDFKAEIKSAFAKIENYNFPDDFIELIKNKDCILYKSVKGFRKKLKQEINKQATYEDLML